MDDRFLYFSNWLHGDLRQYDVSDPENPKLTGQLWLGGVIDKGKELGGKKLGGSADVAVEPGRQKVVCDQFAVQSLGQSVLPGHGEKGSYMLQIECDNDKGGMKVNEKSIVDFGAEPNGPARAHEIRFPGGDCTSDIWV